MSSLHTLPVAFLGRDAEGRLPSAAQLRLAGFRISTAVYPGPSTENQANGEFRSHCLEASGRVGPDQDEEPGEQDEQCEKHEK